tara:strand:+ start:1026 stop:1262 length:237 start_codon:yes stop_codon:yes gene_type:complete
LSDLKNDVGSGMDDVLSFEEILKILSYMPEKASPQEVTALITNIVLAYNLQSEWDIIAHMTGVTLKDVVNMDGGNTVH